MLRALAVLLLLANAGYFAWSQGWLAGIVGPSPLGERDPSRLERQVAPQNVVVLPPQALANGRPMVARPASAEPACIEAGPFESGQIEAAEAALAQALPAGNWARVQTPLPGSYAVYMGRYGDAESLQRKQAELRRMRVAHEVVQPPSELAPGLMLGRFPTPEAAQAALEQFTSRGVRTARVVPVANPRAGWLLRIDGAEPTLVAQAQALKLEALGGGFALCTATGAGAEPPPTPGAPASVAGRPTG